MLNDLLKSPLISLQNGTSVEKVSPSIVTHKSEDDYNYERLEREKITAANSRFAVQHPCIQGQVPACATRSIWRGTTSFRGVTPGEIGVEWGEPDTPPLQQHGHLPSPPRGSSANGTQGAENNFEKQDGERSKTKSLKPAGRIKGIIFLNGFFSLLLKLGVINFTLDSWG